MLAGLLQQINKAKFLLDHHSTTILTGVAVGGTVSTAILTGRSSLKAARLIDQEQNVAFAAWREAESDIPPMDLTRLDKVRLTWKLYIPPVATGIVTVTCMVVANKISSQKIAALAVAGGISERALQEYKDKVVEKLGERQSTALRDEIAQDRVNASGQGVVMVGSGQVLCYDLTTDRYFQNTVEDIKRAENKINAELLNHMAASLAEFHDLIGLRPTTYTDSVGWASPEMFEVIFSSVLSPDGQPCLAIDFKRPPQLEYTKAY